MVELKGQPHLMTQDASTVDPSKLTALTPEVVSSIYCCFCCLCFVYIIMFGGSSWCNDGYETRCSVLNGCFCWLHIYGTHYVGGARGEHIIMCTLILFCSFVWLICKKRYEGCWTYTDIARLADEPVMVRPKYDDAWGQSIMYFCLLQ